MAERAELLYGLKQRKDEKVLDFADRVDGAQYIFDESWPEMAADADANAIARDNEAKGAAHKSGAFDKFIIGLRENIKREVLLKNPGSFDDAKAAAAEVERTFASTARVSSKMAEVSLVDCKSEEAPKGEKANDEQKAEEPKQAAVNAVGSGTAGFSRPRFQGRDLLGNI